MIQILDHRILSSLKEYINYRLLKDLQAYKTVSLNFTKYSDSRLSSKNVYGSSYPFWVYDESITSGIPSGIGSLNRGVSGLALDFKNGRAIVNTGVSIGTGSINIPVSDFHIYVTTKSEMQLINESNFLRLPDLAAANKPLQPDDIVFPALIIRSFTTNNEPYSFGGTDWTIYNIRVLCLTSDNNQIIGLQHVIRDLKERMVPLLSTTPLNEYNDVKSGSWNYENILNSYTDSFYILDSSFQIIENDEFAQKNPNTQIGMGLLKIGVVRRPRL
jgi:hypothetical protein